MDSTRARDSSRIVRARIMSPPGWSRINCPPYECGAGVLHQLGQAHYGEKVIDDEHPLCWGPYKLLGHDDVIAAVGQDSPRRAYPHYTPHPTSPQYEVIPSQAATD